MHIVKCQYEDWKIIPTDLANNIFAKNTLKEGSFAFYLNDWGDFCLMKEREAAESKRREQKDPISDSMCKRPTNNGDQLKLS